MNSFNFIEILQLRFPDMKSKPEVNIRTECALDYLLRPGEINAAFQMDVDGLESVFTSLVYLEFSIFEIELELPFVKSILNRLNNNTNYQKKTCDIQI